MALLHTKPILRLLDNLREHYNSTQRKRTNMYEKRAPYLCHTLRQYESRQAMSNVIWDGTIWPSKFYAKKWMKNKVNNENLYVH